MNKYALIDQSGVVQNVIVWDGKTPYPLPTGWRLEAFDKAKHIWAPPSQGG